VPRAYVILRAYEGVDGGENKNTEMKNIENFITK
jgi:hypothetical protein